MKKEAWDSHWEVRNTHHIRRSVYLAPLELLTLLIAEAGPPISCCISSSPFNKMLLRRDFQVCFCSFDCLLRYGLIRKPTLAFNCQWSSCLGLPWIVGTSYHIQQKLLIINSTTEFLDLIPSIAYT